MSDCTSASTMPSPTPPTLHTANRRSDALNIKASVENKLSDGDVSRAVRVFKLCSDTTLAPVNADTLEALNQRHPPPPPDLQMPPPPVNSSEPISVSTTTIEESIRAFKPGSASGPDKLSPQHIKELMSRQAGAAGSRLLQALTTMENVILSGDIPSQVCPSFFGANLIALRKPDGGVRPIAIGNTLRRMVAKAVSLLMFDTFGNKLRQVHLVSLQCTIYTIFWPLHSRLSHWSATWGTFRSCFVQLSHPVTSKNPFFGIQHLVFGRWHNRRRNKPSTL